MTPCSARLHGRDRIGLLQPLRPRPGRGPCARQPRGGSGCPDPFQRTRGRQRRDTDRLDRLSAVGLRGDHHRRRLLRRCGLAPAGASQRVSAVQGPAEAAALPAVSASTGSRGTSTIRRIPGPDGTTGRSTGTAGLVAAGETSARAWSRCPRCPAAIRASCRARQPEVPERKRFCARCDHPVGRSPWRHGRPHRGVLPPLRRPLLVHAEAVAR